MKKLRIVLVFLAVVIIAGLGVWLGVSVPKWLNLKSGTTTYSTATVLRQVQTLSQLVTVKYVMEKVVIFEDVKWYPGGENRVLLLAHGIVKAGVDLSKIKPEDVIVTEKKISIRLPPPQITDTYLDDQRTRVIEHSTGLLRLFDKDLEQTARQIAVDDIRRAARTAGIQADAEERAQQQLRLLFHQMGFEEVEFLSR